MPSPLGHGGVSRAGRSRTCPKPRIRRSPCRSASARKSALYGNRTRLACSTDRPARQLRHRATQSAWRESNPPIRHGEPVPRPLGHRRFTNSKGGRSRTLCVRVGAALLSQEHALVKQRKGQDSNLQGLCASPGFQPGAIVPVGSPFRNRAVPAGLEPATRWLTTSRTTVVLRDNQRRRQESNLLEIGLQPTAWPSSPGVINHPEPAVGLEPTGSALRGRCPTRRAAPAFCEQPVLGSNQLDRGSEPQSPAEGLANK